MQPSFRTRRWKVTLARCTPGHAEPGGPSPPACWRTRCTSGRVMQFTCIHDAWPQKPYTLTSHRQCSRALSCGARRPKPSSVLANTVRQRAALMQFTCTHDAWPQKPYTLTSHRQCSRALSCGARRPKPSSVLANTVRQRAALMQFTCTHDAWPQKPYTLTSHRQCSRALSCTARLSKPSSVLGSMVRQRAALMQFTCIHAVGPLALARWPTRRPPGTNILPQLCAPRPQVST